MSPRAVGQQGCHPQLWDNQDVSQSPGQPGCHPGLWGSSVYLCLPTSICKGVAEKPHVHRAVSHNQFLKLL
uniref:Uncharacterized protein n=1 Tax=Nothoprocta perdicaria TaxID=30464 RepID=A0A8C7EE25_NOTPE